MANKIIKGESRHHKLAFSPILKSWCHADKKVDVLPQCPRYGAPKEPIKIFMESDYSESRDLFIKRFLKNQFQQRALYFYLSRYLTPDVFVELLYEYLNYPKSRKILNERGFGYLS